jgi:hypothetical protein
MRAEAIGYITQVNCTSCGESFPVFTLSADTDMVTNGLVPMTSITTKDIALCAASPSQSIESLVSRIGADYRYSSVTALPAQAGGLSFQEFLKLPRQPPIYSCIFCHGSAQVVGQESVQQFETHNKLMVYP